ncbi:hypothetical protein [Asticcacaulis sp. AC402]|uniref:hypothetical protein n=1 Tax=Asticcacaulis sp. AC402 TaxID=1282361 RepID=UPI0003C3D763|nr:hypothetical protein [Asticcacaulis sp. AC402]ESQ75288.1 hypothetical protein ABAC402_09290 [Asticcacaulis sp. AC402]
MRKLALVLTTSLLSLSLAGTALAQVKPTGNKLVAPILKKPITPVVSFNPVISSFRMNAGATATRERSVILDIVLGGTPAGVTQYRVSEDPNFAGAGWQTFIAQPSYNLSIGNGTKRVYLQVRGPSPSSPATFVHSNIVSSDITFANPRLTNLTLQETRGFTYGNVAMKVEFEGTANQFRTSQDPGFAGAIWWPLGSNGKVEHVVTGASGPKTIFVQVANGTDFISERMSRAIDYVESDLQLVRLQEAVIEARIEGYTVSATSARGNWECGFEYGTNGQTLTLRAKPLYDLLGFAKGTDQCTFRLFEGKNLAAPWTAATFVQDPGNIPAKLVRVTKAAPISGSSDLGMIIVWNLPGDGLATGESYHSSIRVLQLRGPKHGNWRQAFE